jgi:hypothetical protein
MKILSSGVRHSAVRLKFTDSAGLLFFLENGGGILIRNVGEL